MASASPSPSELRKRLQHNGLPQQLLDDTLTALDDYARLLYSSTITVSSPGMARIEHTVPSQQELNAVSSVFNTEELLEQILLHLPPRDILCGAQLLCRKFRNTVLKTMSIQEKTAMARGIPQRLNLHNITHIGSEQTIPSESNFYTLGTLNAQEWRDFERDFPNAAYQIVVSATNDVKFDHLFAAMHDLLWGDDDVDWDCEGDPCEDDPEYSNERYHEVQVDVSWAATFATLKDEHIAQVFDDSDGSDMLEWTKLLK